MKNRIIKILVTGANGMVGNAIQRISKDENSFLSLIRDKGVIENFEKNKTIYKYIFLGRKELDLTNQEKVINTFAVIKPDVVLHLAAKVGGLFANQEDNQSFYFTNLKMSENLFQACIKHNINYTFSYLSTCIYPVDYDYEKKPITEEFLHLGEPHTSNFGYAFAKRQHEVMARLLNHKGGNHFCLIPNNLYGPCDNFDIAKSHVIPALIAKMFNATNNEEYFVKGSGKALRQFTYVDDIAKQTLAYITCVLHGNSNKYPKLINIGESFETSIYGMTNVIHETLKEFNLGPRKIIFENQEYDEKYDGMYIKTSDLNKINSILFESTYNEKDDYKKIILFSKKEKENIRTTINWFLTNIANKR